MLTVTIPGNPVPTARPRVVVKGGKAHAYIPARSEGYKQAVAFYARAAMRIRAHGVFPMAGNLALRALFVRDSWRRCDLDNLVKGVKDGLTAAGVWEDDSQVTWMLVRKEVSAHEPRTEVTVEMLDGARSYPRGEPDPNDEERVLHGGRDMTGVDGT